MLDQLIIGNKASSDDFCASVASREISAPAKKEIKETVPFSNNTYDFSAINGELYWEERELKYVLEIIADDPVDLEHKKTDFSNWVMNVMNEEIFDPYEPDFHYFGTFKDLDYSDEDCVEKTTATVTFAAYPYKIANAETVLSFVVPNGSLIVVIDNDSAHRIMPTVVSDYAVEIKKGDTTYSFPAGTAKSNSFMLARGENFLLITNNESSDCTVRFSFYREVF